MQKIQAKAPFLWNKIKEVSLNFQQEFRFLSPFDIFCLKKGQRSIIKEIKKSYNDALPTNTITDNQGRTRSYKKGKFAEAHEALASKLYYLVIHRMNEMRTNHPQQYVEFFQEIDNRDSFPVMTNRAELKRLLDTEASLNSIYNRLKILEKAGIILNKTNLSRRRRIVENEDGSTTIVVDQMKGGRGDFYLYINKNLMQFDNNGAVSLYDFETDGDRVKAAENLAMETERLQSNQNQKLGEEMSNTNILIIRNNKSLKRCEQSSPKTIKNPKGLLNNQKEVETKKNNQLGFSAAQIFELKGETRARHEQYHRLLTKVRTLDKLLPAKKKQYFANILAANLFGFLFPNLSPRREEKIRSTVVQLLVNHMDLVDSESLNTAFMKVDRAIYLAYRNANKTGFKFYDPLTYLRIDLDKGGLKSVHKWVEKEDFTLSLNAQKQTELEKWQKLQMFADKQYLFVVDIIKQNYPGARNAIKLARNKIASKAGQLKVNAKTKAKVEKRFADSCLNIHKKLTEQINYQVERDETFQTFLKCVKTA